MCPNCGTHYEKATDQGVGREVEHARVGCEDCRAIEVTRKKFHKANGHKDDTCNCDEFAWWVNKYVPIPEQPTT